MAVKGSTPDPEFDKRNLRRQNAAYYPQNDNLVTKCLRLPQTRVDALEYHFSAVMGQDFSGGVRQILFEWMAANDVKPAPESE